MIKIPANKCDYNKEWYLRHVIGKYLDLEGVENVPFLSVVVSNGQTINVIREDIKHALIKSRLLSEHDFVDRLRYNLVLDMYTSAWGDDGYPFPNYCFSFLGISKEKMEDLVSKAINRKDLYITW